MLKVPRLWTQRYVNLVTALTARNTHAVIYIGSDVVTLGLRKQGAASADTASVNEYAKKRLGSRSNASSLTQSLTLSHIHRILAQLNSSSPITIILPAARFSRINISVPASLAPQDIGPTLSWALQQQGFAPLTDWYWDAAPLTQNDAHAMVYDVVLIETALVEGFLQRIGVASNRLTRLFPDSPVTNSMPLNICGPWLSESQIQQVLSALERLATPGHSSIAGAPDSRPAPPASKSTTEHFNLACNLVARLNRRYQEAFIHNVLIASALLLVGTTWWFQPKDTVTLISPDTIAQSQPAPLTHPLYSHAHVWQQLHALSDSHVEIKRLEFRRNRWLLNIEAQNPGLADAWITQFGERLALQPAGKVGSRSKWHVLTTASRSENGSTQIDLELHQ